MKTILKYISLTAALLIPVLLFLSGCDREEFGIFYSLENEQPTVQSNLRKGVSVTGIVHTADTYYTAAGNIFRKGTGETEWRPVNYPDGFANTLAAGIVNVDGTVYSAFNSLEADTFGVFALNAGDLTWSSNLYSEYPVTAMFSLNGNLFITVQVDTVYTLLQYDGDAFNATSAADTLAVVDGIYTDSGEYWFVTPGTILRGADPAALDTVTPPEVTMPDGTVKAASNFNGIFADGDNVYISTDQGYIINYVNAEGAWTVSPHFTDDTRQENPLRFTDFCSVPHAEETGIIVVGAKGEGYYEFPRGDITAIVEPSGNAYYSTQLSEITVHSFAYFSDGSGGGTLYALTVGNGLWRTAYSSEDPVWFWE
ncbi:MAG: hypothetical protein ACLFST_01670 [Spirochaetia bacterium]